METKLTSDVSGEARGAVNKGHGLNHQSKRFGEVAK